MRNDTSKIDFSQCETRRHFFSRCGVGRRLDGAGLAARRADWLRRAGRSRRTRWRPSRRTSRRRRRTSSTCSWPAGRASSSCSTTSRSCRSTTASRSPSRSSRASGSPSWTRSPRSRRSCSARAASSRSTASRGPWVSELLPHIGRRRRRPRRSSARWRPTSSTTARPSVHQHRLAAVRPAEHGRVGHLRHRQRVAGPARLRRAQSGPRGPRGGAATVGERLPADGLPGRAVPLRRRADPRPVQPAGRHARATSGRRSTRSAT